MNQAYILPNDDDISSWLDMKQFTKTITDNNFNDELVKAHFPNIPGINKKNTRKTRFASDGGLLLRNWIHAETLLEDDMASFVDITDDCHYTTSSSKLSNGCPQLLDPDTSQYWQTDGCTPHTLTIKLTSQTELAYICIYINDTDDSFTPNEINIKTGFNLYGLDHITTVSLAPPRTGWIIIPLQSYGPYLDRFERYAQHKMDTKGCHHMELLPLSTDNSNDFSTGLHNVPLTGLLNEAQIQKLKHNLKYDHHRHRSTESSNIASTNADNKQDTPKNKPKFKRSHLGYTLPDRPDLIIPSHYTQEQIDALLNTQTEKYIKQQDAIGKTPYKITLDEFKSILVDNIKTSNRIKELLQAADDDDNIYDDTFLDDSENNTTLDGINNNVDSFDHMYDNDVAEGEYCIDNMIGEGEDLLYLDEYAEGEYTLSENDQLLMENSLEDDGSDDGQSSTSKQPSRRRAQRNTTTTKTISNDDDTIDLTREKDILYSDINNIECISSSIDHPLIENVYPLLKTVSLYIQVEIVSSYLLGKDARLRGIRLYAFNTKHNNTTTTTTTTTSTTSTTSTGPVTTNTSGGTDDNTATTQPAPLAIGPSTTYTGGQGWNWGHSLSQLANITQRGGEKTSTYIPPSCTVLPYTSELFQRGMRRMR